VNVGLWHPSLRDEGWFDSGLVAEGWFWDDAIQSGGQEGSVQLVVQDAALALAADNLVLVQHNLLVVADATLGLAAEAPTLTAHDPAVQLVVQDALFAFGADSPALTQHNALVVQDALIALMADEVDFSPAEEEEPISAPQLFLQPALVAVDEAVEMFEESCCL
jgi:hypothetical protein